MSVFYRLHQDKSTGTKRSGKWYARAVPTAAITAAATALTTTSCMGHGPLF
jgi:hypothetical protein